MIQVVDLRRPLPLEAALEGRCSALPMGACEQHPPMSRGADLKKTPRVRAPPAVRWARCPSCCGVSMI